MILQLLLLTPMGLVSAETSFHYMNYIEDDIKRMGKGERERERVRENRRAVVIKAVDRKHLLHVRVWEEDL